MIKKLLHCFSSFENYFTPMGKGKNSVITRQQCSHTPVQVIEASAYVTNQCGKVTQGQIGVGYITFKVILTISYRELSSFLDTLV